MKKIRSFNENGKGFKNALKKSDADTITKLLKIPAKDLLHIAGIKKMTVYKWKQYGRIPNARKAVILRLLVLYRDMQNDLKKLLAKYKDAAK